MHLWIKSLQYKEMTRILETIVELLSAQESLERLINQKKFSYVVMLYRSTEKTVNNADLAEIGALENIRLNLVNKKLVSKL